jgi:hypothetical protein
MRFKAIPAPLIELLLITLSVAQTKISGTSKCGQPDQQQKIEIGDEPNHAFAISQGKCAWTKPIDMAGIQTKEDVVTGSDEFSGECPGAWICRGHYVKWRQVPRPYSGHRHVQGKETSELLKARGVLSGVPGN